MVHVEVVDQAEELLAEMLDLHAEGLRRVLARLDPGVVSELAEDAVVSRMLLVHGLHPIPLGQRVAAGLDAVRPYLASHGGDVELTGIEDGVAHLVLKGGYESRGASASAFEHAIERALREGAPDLKGIDVARATAPPAGSEAAPGRWIEVELTPGPGEIAPVDDGLLVANVGGSLFAYRDSCAGCGASLLDGVLEEDALECAECHRRFSLPQAGRVLGTEKLQLAPVALLEESGRVRVSA